MADLKTLWTTASKSVRGTASPTDTALRYMSLYFCEDAAWANISQTAFIIYNGDSSRLRVGRRALSRFYFIGSNFNP